MSVDCIYTDIPYLYEKGGKGYGDLADRKQKNNDRSYIGIEIEEQWHKIACDRLDGIDANGKMSMLLY